MGQAPLLGTMKVVICINKSAGLVIQRQWCLLVHACVQKSHLGTGGQMPVLKEYFSQILGEKLATKTFPSQHHCADTEHCTEMVYHAGEGMQTYHSQVAQWSALPAS